MEINGKQITGQQANTLIELLNVATKAEGLSIAQNCLFFVKEIQEDFKKQDLKKPIEKKIEEKIKDEK